MPVQTKVVDLVVDELYQRMHEVGKCNDDCPVCKQAPLNRQQAAADALVSRNIQAHLVALVERVYVGLNAARHEPQAKTDAELLADINDTMHNVFGKWEIPK